MTPAQVAKMYPTIPPELFREHDWRHDTVTVGTVPAAATREPTNLAIDADWHATLNRLVVEAHAVQPRVRRVKRVRARARGASAKN